MRRLSFPGLIAAALAAAAPAQASNLVALIDAPKEQLVITKSFVATDPTTLLIFGGYQVPSFWQATGISVTRSGNPTNLLVPAFDLTRAKSGSLAEQAIAPGIVGLEFGGTFVGSYDLFSQNFSTIAGETYTLSFLFTQDYAGANGMKVTVDETLAQVEAENTSAVPEASVWTMMLAGFGGIGFGLRRRNRQAIRAKSGGRSGGPDGAGHQRPR